MVILNRSLFGSPLESAVLLLIHLLGETYCSELARITEAAPYSIQRIVAKYVKAGVVASRTIGRENRLAMSRSFFAATQLTALLEQLAAAEPTLVEKAFALRRRPVRRGARLV